MTLPLAPRSAVTGEEQLATEFEAHRPYLHVIAFRMLGSHADADDAVQEAWLRLARTGGGGIEDLRGWPDGSAWTLSAGAGYGRAAA
jgi:DNA-directed RNA polymerase specialized sigma24 family protein